MKNFYLLIFLLTSMSLSAQEQKWAIGNEFGRVINLGKSAKGFQYGFDLQRHLTLGIHGVIGYGRTQLFDGFNPQVEQDQVPRSITQFNNYSLGFKKTLKISKFGAIGIFLKGSWIQKTGSIWNPGPDNFGPYNLENLSGKYFKRNDLSYGINLEYIHRMGKNLSLGCYASYLSKTGNSSDSELLSFGLRTAVTLGQPDNYQSSKPSENKNWMEWTLGAYGGDGTPTIANFDFILGRKLYKSISIFGKFSIGQRTMDDPNIISNLDEDQLRLYEDNKLLPGNEAGLIYLIPSQSSSYGLGLKVKINGEGRSALYVSGGANYFVGQFVKTSSSGSQFIFLSESFTQYKTILPEFGLHYDFDLTDSFYIGGKGTIALNRLNIGLGVHAGFRF